MKPIFYKEAREDTVVKSKTWLSYKRDNRLSSTLRGIITRVWHLLERSRERIIG